MYTENTTFRCTECKHRFNGPYCEYRGMRFATPLKCPQCGSIRTMPADTMQLLNYFAYQKIWNELER
jgi:DNA replicative helicase MCM subunit Mcm2 (Cdc46/Mcm family)